MRVPNTPIKLAGSWRYLTGSWREVTHILINIRENELLILNSDFLHLFNQLGIRIMSHNIQIANQEATLNTKVVEPD